MKKRTAITLVAGERGEQWIAFAHAETVGTEIELLRLGVLPERRREGWATLLLDVLGDVVPLVLRLREYNEGGLSWAKAVGFRAVGLERAASGGDWITLRRPKNSVAGG
jgi:hypothetical protein